MRLTNTPVSRLRCLAIFMLLSFNSVSFAAESVEVEDMISALKPPVPVKTRSLKYVGAAEEAATVERPSLSLDIPFEYDSSALTAKGRDVLDKLAKAMRSPALQLATFEVQGHTDAKGSRDYNTRLSDERAKSVINYLVQDGNIPVAQLVPVGKGSSEPEDRNDPFSAVNRRVKIITVK